MNIKNTLKRINLFINQNFRVVLIGLTVILVVAAMLYIVFSGSNQELTPEQEREEYSTEEFLVERQGDVLIIETDDPYFVPEEQLKDQLGIPESESILIDVKGAGDASRTYPGDPVTYNEHDDSESEFHN